MVELTKIENIIAEDVWEYIDSNGYEKKSKISIGKPVKEKKDIWYCPILIENYTDRIVPAYGSGAVHAIMNAMILANSFFDEIYEKKDNKINSTD